MTTTRIPMSKVRVSTSDYQWSWGRMPSGCGGWVFLLGRHGSDGRPDMSDGETFGWNGSFSDAKRGAIKYAAEKGYTFAKVCS